MKGSAFRPIHLLVRMEYKNFRVAVVTRPKTVDDDECAVSPLAKHGLKWKLSIRQTSVEKAAAMNDPTSLIHESG